MIVSWCSVWNDSLGLEVGSQVLRYVFSTFVRAKAFDVPLVLSLSVCNELLDGLGSMSFML